MAKIELYNDNYANWKSYNIPAKAQLVIADIPYQIGNNAYGSDPRWYKDGDNKNGESKLAGQAFFRTDAYFKIPEFFHFCSKLLKKEPKERGKAPAMIVFCSWQQIPMVQEQAARYGFNNAYPLYFIKRTSGQVLKSNMKIVGATETAVVLYRDKLPKFNNGGRMILNWMKWIPDKGIPRIHPCLPKGEKVYINESWMNIEDVKVGDKSKYGEVVDTSCHIADRIVEIETITGTTKATWNHPFLVKRCNEIAWINADGIVKGDEILWRTDVKPYINQRQKDISDCQKKGSTKWSTLSSGNGIMEQSRKGIKSTTLTETSKIITLPTYCLSLPLNTNGYTKVADLSTANGINRVQSVESIKNVTVKTGICQEDILTGDCAESVSVKNPSESVQFVSLRVGSVKNIEKPTEVYNLTIDGTPAFDTVIGCSHNTQKPVNLLKNLIEIFTDAGDVVIDPCAGSGSTLRACAEIGRNCYGFEVDKKFYREAKEKMLAVYQQELFA